MDIPASDPNSAGIFDGNIAPAPGKTLRETTKELVENLKANAIKHQGYAFRELIEKYVNDPHGLEHLRNYKEQFERDAVLPDEHNAHYRVRSNFAVMYAAAALSIDYEILPWKKRPTFRAIEKCMRLALATLATGAKEPGATMPAIDTRNVGRTLMKRIAEAELVTVKPKQKVTEAQARARQKADGFKINGEIYVKPDRFKRWVPTHPSATFSRRKRSSSPSGRTPRPWRGKSAVSKASPDTMPSTFAPSADWHRSDPGGAGHRLTPASWFH